MSSFETTAFISTVKYLPTTVIVYLDEYHKGFKRSDGTIVEDKFYTYKTIWKQYFKKYISEHFNRGMLVQVKGELLPFAVENGTQVDGYTIIGQCINAASFPRSSAKAEMKMIKESMEGTEEQPDLETYNQPDFYTTINN